jgi:hypothetical protein
MMTFTRSALLEMDGADFAIAVKAASASVAVLFSE